MAKDRVILLPPSPDDIVAEEHPARTVREIVEERIISASPPSRSDLARLSVSWGCGDCLRLSPGSTGTARNPPRWPAF